VRSQLWTGARVHDEWNDHGKEAKRARALLNASQLVSSLMLAVALAGSPGCRDSSASNGAAAAPPPSSTSSANETLVLPGVDVSAMTPRERREWSSIVGTTLAPCPSTPVSVAQCIAEARACGACLQAAKWMARAVSEGASDDQIRRAYKQRFDPAGVRPIPIEGSPVEGPDQAPVTIVEFADFECPHCRQAVPLLDAVLHAHGGKVRLVYKSFTLPFHVHGEPAARAALAAGQQGKFWEMEHVLFERQDHLEDADLERYARALRLDIARWKSDMDSVAVKDRIAHDHALGEDMKLKGTPTIYVNGRELDIEADESLEDRVAGELGVPPVPLALPESAPPGSGPTAPSRP
jgi:protein-disulfide isomerase